MNSAIDAYLDIETTGLSRFHHYITVIGIFLCNGQENRLIQLTDAQVTRNNLTRSLRGVSTIYTYNGSRFDFPFIEAFLGIDLDDNYCHHDLMYDCWRCNLRGGFKAVEQQLGIPRQLKGISGWDAVMLWWRYKIHNDRNALALLLQYNKEDVVNLKTLRERLNR